MDAGGGVGVGQVDGNGIDGSSGVLGGDFPGRQAGDGDRLEAGEFEGLGGIQQMAVDGLSAGVQYGPRPFIGRYATVPGREHNWPGECATLSKARAVANSTSISARDVPLHLHKRSAWFPRETVECPLV